MPNERPYIRVDNLQLIFGKGKRLQQAQHLYNDGATNAEIREQTRCTVGVRYADFHIKKGETFVIVGLSGSGKSSLIRCFNRLNKATGGSITIDGMDVTKLDKKELLELRRNKISMVFQSFGLLSHRTVLANVEYGLEVKGIPNKDRDEMAKQAIELVGLKGWETYYPHQLSGGMKQRVGLARAIANDPDILLMDEPYSALDPLIRREMQKELLNLEDYIDKTIVFITHDMNEAFRLGDRIALMKDGEIVQLGKPASFFENPANDYVRDFIADVDKTQVLRAKQIMKEIPVSFTPDTPRTDARDKLAELELDVAFVTDEENHYLGYVTFEDLDASRKMTVEKLLKTDLEPYYRQNFIKDLISLLDEADYDVPIVDSKNRLRGSICHEVLISAIS